MAGPKIAFVTEKRVSSDGWARTVTVGGVEYQCSVRHWKPVRIAYKPRGQNRGWKWWGTVYKTGGGRVWSGEVPGSIGCRGLLAAAGLVE